MEIFDADAQDWVLTRSTRLPLILLLRQYFTARCCCCSFYDHYCYLHAPSLLSVSWIKTCKYMLTVLPLSPPSHSRAPRAVDAQSNDKGVVVPAEHLLQQDTTQGCDLTSNPFVRPPRTPREARYICAQLLSALAYLHRQTPPIVFRDVKPDNVLIWGVDSDPDTGEQLLTVKLTDYGTVRQLDVRDMTAGSGTKQFMAPEVDEAATPQPSQSCSSSSGGARAAKSSAASFTAKPVALYDTSVDVFSVGATFFYLVTGVAPDGNTKLEWKERFGARLPFEAAPHSKQQHALSGDGAAAMVVSPRDQMNVDVPGGSTTPRDVAAAAAAPPSLFESSRRGDTAAATASAAAGKKPAESVFSHFFPRGSHARVFLESLVHRAPTASPADEPHSRTGSVSSSVTASINTSSSDGGGMTPLTPSVTTTTTTTSVEGAPRSGSGSSAPKRWTAEQALEYLHSTWTDAIAKDEQLRAAQQQR